MTYSHYRNENVRTFYVGAPSNFWVRKCNFNVRASCVIQSVRGRTLNTQRGRGTLNFNHHTLTDLTDLPSQKNEELKESRRQHAERDKQICKKLKLRSWENKKVRGFLNCYECGKRRCLYTPTEQDWENHKLLVQQKLESVGYRYSCGDLLFGDGPLSEVVGQKQSLTCESKIE